MYFVEFKREMQLFLHALSMLHNDGGNHAHPPLWVHVFTAFQGRAREKGECFGV